MAVGLQADLPPARPLSAEEDRWQALPSLPVAQVLPAPLVGLMFGCNPPHIFAGL